VVLHRAIGYDLLVWLLTFGRERSFREKILAPAGLQVGEAVLDVGCGTGTLAMLARRKVGPAGIVRAMDASPEMIVRARTKAARAGLDVDFQEGIAQKIPFPDAQFDVVLSTLMLHHLPRSGRQKCFQEIRRVLKPRGRMLAVDFIKPVEVKRKWLDHFHRRHGHINFDEIVPMLRAAGLMAAGQGAIGMHDLHFILATIS
jgi:ubiquinone/menaquinone biosynthesis C-methylase UbiE